MKSSLLLLLALLLTACDKTPTDPALAFTSKNRVAEIPDTGGNRIYIREICVDGITYFTSDAGDDHVRYVIGGAKVDSEGKPITCK